MIQIEIYKDQVFLSVDKDGADALIESLNYLKNGGDHDHFMSPAWGGDELTGGLRIRDDSSPVNHLEIFFIYGASNQDQRAEDASVH